MGSGEELLDFSGNGDPNTLSIDEPELMLLNETTTTTTTTTTPSPILGYTPNPFRIAVLSIKCLLIILIFTLSCTIRRDYFKFFVVFLVVPLFIEAGFDVFTEIHAATFGTKAQKFEYLNLSPDFELENVNFTVTDWQKDAIKDYAQVLQHYTTYTLYTSDAIFPLVSYIFSDFFFWSLLFSTTTVFFYAHKAVVRPEQIIYEPIGKSFIKIQILPILFTAINTLLAYFSVPEWIYLAVLTIVRLTALALVGVAATQIFASLFLFCRTKDELTKTSPYEQVRNSKLRLFLLVLFTIGMNVLNAPYIIWSALSLTQDINELLSFEWYLPLHFVHEMFTLHLTFYLIRPYVFLIFTLIFLNPYRRRFFRFFCACCKRN
ncbi:unnamed protein product [Caenorhabditis angaria]|uniref:Uncharacterized protein n=1 Tax=Caenorhabditis angaria TaxID=860376 RepID=A0A9P1IRL8_9PELO|nr:unnamed protein product [Caenorhabditis angaria]